MLTFYSFLQTVFHFVKSLVTRVTKKMYRSAAVLSTGFAVVLVVALTSSGFGGGGKNALTVFAETRSDLSDEAEEEPEEIEFITEAKIQVDLTDSRRQGRLVVGKSLEKDVQEQQENEAEAREKLEQVKQEILEEEQAKAEAEARRAEEEARKAEEEARKAAAVVSYSEQDYQVLLQIVQAEAGICDEKGKILVANVVLNRVRSQQFPDTITDVVYQPSQFSPVSNGSIHRVKVTDETIDCVNRALVGEDYSQGALYFMYRGASRAHAVSWFDGNLTFLFQHEQHEFFK